MMLEWLVTGGAIVGQADRLGNAIGHGQPPQGQFLVHKDRDGELRQLLALGALAPDAEAVDAVAVQHAEELVRAAQHSLVVVEFRLGHGAPPGAGRAARRFALGTLTSAKRRARDPFDLEAFERAVQAIPEVQVVQHVLGIYDYRLKVVARDLSDFERILRRRIMTLPGVGVVESNVMLSQEKAAGPPL